MGFIKKVICTEVPKDAAFNAVTPGKEYVVLKIDVLEIPEGQDVTFLLIDDNNQAWWFQACYFREVE